MGFKDPDLTSQMFSVTVADLHSTGMCGCLFGPDYVLLVSSHLVVLKTHTFPC